MSNVYGIEDMVFAGFKIKHKDINEWLESISNKTKLVKISFTDQESGLTGHAIGILDGEKKGEIYFNSLEK